MDSGCDSLPLPQSNSRLQDGMLPLFPGASLNIRGLETLTTPSPPGPVPAFKTRRQQGLWKHNGVEGLKVGSGTE